MAETDPQVAAARSTRPNLIVVAPPGCGKTELLAMRAEFLIPRMARNQRILALTFSNKAKRNLAERMRNQLGASSFRRYVTVRNFHGHAAEVVQAHFRTLNIAPDFKMPTRSTTRRAIASVTSDWDEAAKLEAVLGAAKRQPRSDFELLATLDLEGNTDLLTIEKARVLANQMHYDDLLRHAQRLLQIDEISRLYRSHYGGLLVDEFQDLSAQQLDVALLSCSTNRTFAGDPLQGIYSWAGAQPEEVHSQLSLLCGDPITLNRSFRSSPAVLCVVNKVTASMGAAALTSANAQVWPDGGQAVALVFDTAAKEAEKLVEFACSITSREPESTVGVITRSGWRRKELEAVIRARGVSCIRWDLALDDPAILDRMRTALNRMPRTTTVSELESVILNELGSSDVDTYGELVEAFETLREMEESTGSLRAAMASLEMRDDEAAIVPGIHLLNAHTGKGQQFDWVLIPGLEDGHLPDFRAKSAAELDEERRVLLVMISRAKQGLVLSRASSRLSKKNRPYSPDPSRWWADLESACPRSAGLQLGTNAV